MLQLALDIGNTSIKAGLFQQNELLEKKLFTEQEEVREWWQGKNISKAIISNVGKEWVLPIPFPTFFFGEKELSLPIQNAYKTPHTLGKDRLAAAIGAHSIFPGYPCLVVDMGTCITYDFVTERATYLGGAISPGLNMRFRAMHEFTARLPLIEEIKSEPELIGNTTEECMLSGVLNGIYFEMEKTIDTYTSKYPGLKVLLCGGDVPFFESIIKGHIFAFPNLVLQGLNHTLLYNAHS
jgi:type III pantothenate kinase